MPSKMEKNKNKKSNNINVLCLAPNKDTNCETFLKKNKTNTFKPGEVDQN